MHVQIATGSAALQEVLSVDPSTIGLIDIDMAGGNDTVSIASAGKAPSAAVNIPSIIRGGLGSDVIDGGAAPADARQSNRIYGNRDNATDDALDGDDVITSHGNNDQVFGGGGNDTITTQGANAAVDGGSGIDLINGTLVVPGTDGPDQILITQQSGTFVVGAPGQSFAPPVNSQILVQRTNLLGQMITLRTVSFSTIGANTLQRIEVDGGLGDDRIVVQPNVTFPAFLNGGAGNDFIQAGRGPSTIHGGDGNDELHGGSAANTVFGDAGDDLIFGGADNDTLDGGAGTNVLHPGGGTNRLQASTNDLILSEGGLDTIQGGNPVVTAFEVNHGLATRSRVTSLTLHFNRDVSASLTATQISLVAANGLAIDPAALGVSWDATSNTATVTFPGLPEMRLPNGSFSLALRGLGVKDSSGNALTDFATRIFALTGDANGDGVVDSRDLYDVWQNSLKPLAAQDPAADLNGDGQVNQADVRIVSAHYLAQAP